ncbi:hypothetical protein KCP71_00955 [Salmonella enterica subsp. enterica]|nr:hypothetical protein KCP71_00955 [Salmonella enterica subsp. enterica]
MIKLYVVVAALGEHWLNVAKSIRKWLLTQSPVYIDAKIKVNPRLA